MFGHTFFLFLFDSFIEPQILCTVEFSNVLELTVVAEIRVGISFIALNWRL